MVANFIVSRCFTKFQTFQDILNLFLSNDQVINSRVCSFSKFGISFDESSIVEIEQKYVFNVILLAVSSVRMCPVVGSFN